MRFGNLARITAGLAIAAQIIVTLVVLSIFSLPQSVARASEPDTRLEANDIPLTTTSLVADACEEPADLEPVTEASLQSLDDNEGNPDLSIVFDTATLPAKEIPEYQAYPREIYSPDDLRIQGVIYDGGHRYTWYSQRVLPGGGLDIEGRHVSDDGYVVDSQERIVVASSDLAKGTEIDIPFGGGKAVVLDSGCVSGTIDVYTDF